MLLTFIFKISTLNNICFGFKVLFDMQKAILSPDRRTGNHVLSRIGS